MCVCEFQHKPAVELTLSQCGPRAPHTRQELVGKNTKLQLVQEGLLERPPWSLTLARGPDPKVEIVYPKGQPQGERGPSPGGHGMGGTGWKPPSGASGDEDLTALGVGSLPAAARTGRSFQKQRVRGLFNSRKKEKG